MYIPENVSVYAIRKASPWSSGGTLVTQAKSHPKFLCNRPLAHLGTLFSKNEHHLPQIVAMQNKSLAGTKFVRITRIVSDNFGYVKIALELSNLRQNYKRNCKIDLGAAIDL